MVNLSLKRRAASVCKGCGNHGCREAETDKYAPEPMSAVSASLTSPSDGNEGSLSPQDRWERGS